MFSTMTDLNIDFLIDRITIRGWQPASYCSRCRPTYTRTIIQSCSSKIATFRIQYISKFTQHNGSPRSVATCKCFFVPRSYVLQLPTPRSLFRSAPASDWSLIRYDIIENYMYLGDKSATYTSRHDQERRSIQLHTAKGLLNTSRNF